MHAIWEKRQNYVIKGLSLAMMMDDNISHTSPVLPSLSLSLSRKRARACSCCFLHPVLRSYITVNICLWDFGSSWLIVRGGQPPSKRSSRFAVNIQSLEERGFDEERKRKRKKNKRSS